MLEIGPIKMLLKRYISEHEGAMRTDPELIVDKDLEKHTINQCRKALAVLDTPMNANNNRSNSTNNPTSNH